MAENDNQYVIILNLIEIYFIWSIKQIYDECLKENYEEIENERN